jgi:hypothetical protein
MTFAGVSFLCYLSRAFFQALIDDKQLQKKTTIEFYCVILFSMIVLCQVVIFYNIYFPWYQSNMTLLWSSIYVEVGEAEYRYRAWPVCVDLVVSSSRTTLHQEYLCICHGVFGTCMCHKSVVLTPDGQLQSAYPWNLHSRRKFLIWYWKKFLIDLVLKDTSVPFLIFKSFFLPNTIPTFNFHFFYLTFSSLVLFKSGSDKRSPNHVKLKLMNFCSDTTNEHEPIFIKKRTHMPSFYYKKSLMIFKRSLLSAYIYSNYWPNCVRITEPNREITEPVSMVQ